MPDAVGDLPVGTQQTSAPAAYYTISGLRLPKAPANGTYIEVKDGKSRKLSR